MALEWGLAGIFVADVICCIRGNVLIDRMREEVNGRRPEGNKISVYEAKSRMFDIIREHRGFFPDSVLRRSMWRFLVAFVGLFILVAAGAVWMSVRTPH
jgi:hypothetical protein